MAESVTIQFTDPMLYNRLHTLSAEYALSMNVLLNVAIRHLLDDVDLIRGLRTGKLPSE